MCLTKIPGQRPFAECPRVEDPSRLFGIQHPLHFLTFPTSDYHQLLRTLIRCIYSRIHHQVICSYYISCRTFLNAADVKARSFRGLIGGVISIPLEFAPILWRLLGWIRTVAFASWELYQRRSTILQSELVHDVLECKYSLLLNIP